MNLQEWEVSEWLFDENKRLSERDLINPIKYKYFLLSNIARELKREEFDMSNLVKRYGIETLRYAIDLHLAAEKRMLN
jgi:hypothetical protein